MSRATTRSVQEGTWRRAASCYLDRVSVSREQQTKHFYRALIRVSQQVSLLARCRELCAYLALNRVPIGGFERIP